MQATRWKLGGVRTPRYRAAGPRKPFFEERLWGNLTRYVNAAEISA
jgi:hypothetical protein